MEQAPERGQALESSTSHGRLTCWAYPWRWKSTPRRALGRGGAKPQRSGDVDDAWWWCAVRISVTHGACRRGEEQRSTLTRGPQLEDGAPVRPADTSARDDEGLYPALSHPRCAARRRRRRRRLPGAIVPAGATPPSSSSSSSSSSSPPVLVDLEARRQAAGHPHRLHHAIMRIIVSSSADAISDIISSSAPSSASSRIPPPLLPPPPEAPSGASARSSPDVDASASPSSS